MSKQSNGSRKLAGQIQLNYKRNGNTMKVLIDAWIIEFT
jgi:hypothetical protein